MSNEPNIAISAKNLSKTYRVYNSPTDVLLEAVTRKPRHTNFDALTDVSFEVPKGEILGVLGRNGAGKSTLLKVLTGATQPTGGSVEIEGRVSQMLELGTGFHADRTGRENVFLGGFCLGMSRPEVEEKFDRIVAFSELGEFIDRPFKTYSLGMQARLTFAVAVHVDPDVLIIDEWLAVGDARFALKCYERIRQFREEGATIVFVTHNYNSVTEFCDRGLVLDHGKVAMLGEPQTAVGVYMGLLYGTGSKIKSTSGVEQDNAIPTSSRGARTDPDALNKLEYLPNEADLFERSAEQLPWQWDMRKGSGDVKVLGLALTDASGSLKSTFENGDRVTLHMRLRSRQTISGMSAGFYIKTSDGRAITSTDSDLHRLPNLRRVYEEGEHLEFSISFDIVLAGGHYFLGVSLAHEDGTRLDVIDAAILLEILPTPTSHTDCIVHTSSHFVFDGTPVNGA